MRVMITGVNGQLGWELSRQVGRTNMEPILFDRDGLDISDQSMVARIFAVEKPDLLINAAAYTKVDLAESQPDTAFTVNRDAPGYLAQCCATAGIPMIHISTDYVFDGSRSDAYPESFPLSPIGVYGRSKAEGEGLVQKYLDRYLIVRTSWVYGIHGQNFVKTMLRHGREKDRIGVVSDQAGSPTSATDLAEALLLLASQIEEKKDIRWGIYHYCGQGITTWFDFARAIFDAAHLFGYPHTPLVAPIPTADYPTAVKRPAFSALDCRLISQYFGIIPRPWKESLIEVLKEILSES
jgi:dTDP-4-dehydrorhamnose reductase